MKIYCKQCGATMEKDERVVDTRKADVSTEEFYYCPECGQEFIPKQ